MTTGVVYFNLNIRRIVKKSEDKKDKNICKEKLGN